MPSQLNEYDLRRMIALFGSAIMGQNKERVLTTMAAFVASCCDRFGSDREDFVEMLREVPDKETDADKCPN